MERGGRAGIHEQRLESAQLLESSAPGIGEQPDVIGDAHRPRTEAAERQSGRPVGEDRAGQRHRCEVVAAPTSSPNISGTPRDHGE